MRMLLPHLKDNGWEPSILTVEDPSEHRARDDRLMKTIPAGIKIQRVRCPKALPGFGSLGLRSYFALKKAGEKWIRRERPDLIYISTTEFDLFCLGFAWKRATGVPYVLDYQDPWQSDYYNKPGAPTPPGGRWKYAFSQWRARRWEPRCVEGASGISCVSPLYVEELKSKYPQLRAKPVKAIPFGVSEIDWSLAGKEGKVAWEGKLEGRRVWLNLGRLAPSMRPALSAFFRSLKKSPPSPETLILFLGSSYEVGRVSEVNPEGLAASICPGVRVEAWPGRIPMLDAIKSLQNADRLLFFGSEDPGYQPSRLYPYLRSAKPLLSILHRESPAFQWISKVGFPGVVGFLPGEAPEEVAARILRQNWEKVSQQTKIFTCGEMTQEVCRLFGESSAS